MFLSEKKPYKLIVVSFLAKVNIFALKR